MIPRTVQADRLTMSVEERAEYEEWREARAPYRDGSAQQRAFIAGMRAQRRVDAAEKINDQVADCDEDEQEALNQRLQALYERLDELDAATAEARHGLGDPAHAPLSQPGPVS